MCSTKTHPECVDLILRYSPGRRKLLNSSKKLNCLQSFKWCTRALDGTFLIPNFIFLLDIADMVRETSSWHMNTYSSSAYPLPFGPLGILLAGKCNRAMSGRGALVFWSNPLTQTYPLQKQCWISSVVRPLNMVGIEVPKYTVLLGKFHNQDLGTSIGLRLESWSAKTSLTWKYVPLSGKLPLMAVLHGIRSVPRTIWEFASRWLPQ